MHAHGYVYVCMHVHATHLVVHPTIRVGVSGLPHLFHCFVISMLTNSIQCVYTEKPQEQRDHNFSNSHGDPMSGCMCWPQRVFATPVMVGPRLFDQVEG